MTLTEPWQKPGSRKLSDPTKKMVAFVKTLKAAGHKIILWTSRSHADLENAVEWCQMQGLTFDAVNEPLPEQIAKWNNDTRKVYADYYIDDKAMTVEAAEKIMDEILGITQDFNGEKFI